MSRVYHQRAKHLLDLGTQLEAYTRHLRQIGIASDNLRPVSQAA
jgi:hypothetical protein